MFEIKCDIPENDIVSHVTHIYGKEPTNLALTASASNFFHSFDDLEILEHEYLLKTGEILYRYTCDRLCGLYQTAYGLIEDFEGEDYMDYLRRIIGDCDD